MFFTEMCCQIFDVLFVKLISRGPLMSSSFESQLKLARLNLFPFKQISTSKLPLLVQGCYKISLEVFKIYNKNI